ncbi:MFS general substrate transporter [Thelephora terrestris]|uniref:MFS general substrate transporter n=1 Tax=Thelephora terrestris TaxID=56493 RepID=A0A9P6HH05_9AGAM|nr:MFS general substrate transporter [Thelephora terrestris]
MVSTHSLNKVRGAASSMDNVRIQPRTPRQGMHDTELELTLLEEDEQRQASVGVLNDDGDSTRTPRPKRAMSTKDQRAMSLLITLYLIQGVPVSLYAHRSVPFLLREHLSYSQLAVFSLASYPYSLKLFWSPIVDSKFLPTVGRRKSWIIPMQLIIGTIMFAMSFHAEKLIQDPTDNINLLSMIFTGLVFFSATQDIAVDGWALTLLSEENLSYASTCQTIGLTTGYFASFTVFLALNSEAFANKWGIPRLTMDAYLRFWGVVCYSVTAWLFFVKEDKEVLNVNEMDVKRVYLTIWDICKLKHVQSLLALHFVAKIGFQANDAVTQLKMVEKGLKKEDLAIIVLLDFPFQMMGGWIAGKFSTGNRALRPWLLAFWPRLGFALSSTLVVYWFPVPPITKGFLAFLVAHSVLQSFAGTIQFVGVSAFHTIISDPLIGGTYMTLLNTFSNLGGTWPKYFVLKGVDYFSVATCKLNDAGRDITIQAQECVSDQGKSLCESMSGQCVTTQDGYYYVSAICMGLGVLTLVLYIIPTARRLEALPVARWRVASAL